MGRRCTPHSPRLPRLVAPAATWVFGPRQAPVPQPGTRGPAPARRPRPLTPATRGQHDGGLAQSRFWSTTGYGHRRRPLQNRDWRAAPATGYPSHAGRLLRPRPQHRTAAGSTTPAATTEYKPSQTPSGGSPHRPAHRNQQQRFIADFPSDADRLLTRMAVAQWKGFTPAPLRAADRSRWLGTRTPTLAGWRSRLPAKVPALIALTEVLVPPDTVTPSVCNVGRSRQVTACC